jgi:hypothetical protein
MIIGGCTSTGGCVVLGLLYLGSRHAASGRDRQLPTMLGLGWQDLAQQSPPVERLKQRRMLVGDERDYLMRLHTACDGVYCQDGHRAVQH